MSKLIDAVKNNDIENVRILLVEGDAQHMDIDPNLKNREGHTALLIAAIYGYTDIVRLLLKYDADPNIKDNYGDTALMGASDKGHIDIVRLLLEKGADPDIKNKYEEFQDPNHWEMSDIRNYLYLEYDSNQYGTNLSAKIAAIL